MASPVKIEDSLDVTTPKWTTLLAEAVADGTCYRLIASRPLTSDTSPEVTVQKVTVRPIDINGAMLWQWASRRGAQETHENLTAETFLDRIGHEFGKPWRDLHWFAATGDVVVRWKPRRPPKVQRKPPTQTPTSTAHNRTRQYLIPEGVPCPFLIEAGLMLPDGRVKPTASHKFRQINRYVEFLADIVPQLPAEGPIRIVDFGCGKSSLTFAVHHYFHTILGRQVEIVGLDLKADVIAHCQATADRLGCAGLRFRAGDIASYTPDGPVDLAISLHACDTATDDSLAAALRWNCAVILAVPCCQHELAQHWGDALPGITGYGLLKERFAALATDALRSRFLESRGYRTQVLEFIDLEHTPKNVLIRAVRRSPFSPADAAARQEEYETLKRELHVTSWHLERVAPA